MAQLELSADEARQLVEALRMVEIPWMDSGRDYDPLLAIRDRTDSLKFNTRQCAACGVEFEAANPRKQTCSDACRQSLSRSKRPAPLFAKGDWVKYRNGKASDGFTVTTIKWKAGLWMYVGADGLGLPEAQLKLAKKPSQPKRDKSPG